MLDGLGVSGTAVEIRCFDQQILTLDNENNLRLVYRTEGDCCPDLTHRPHPLVGVPEEGWLNPLVWESIELHAGKGGVCYSFPMVTKKSVTVPVLQTPPEVGYRQISTPRGDFFILSSKTSSAVVAPKDQMVSHLLPKMAKAMLKPGLNKKAVFRSNAGKTVYAYSIDPNNPDRLIRENASGDKTPGRMSGASFRRTAAA
ncbi:MAG: hypothetical protein KA777_08640 [Rhodoferax sp.]|nr:hypothetical protein [Rhodoferax sp.]